MKIGIIGITGYAGSELARLLHRHRHVELTSVTGLDAAGVNAAGKGLGEFFPHLSGLDLTIQEELDLPGLDLAFCALPHKVSAEFIGPLLEQGVKVVDLSADFRLKSVTEYEQWYGVVHPYPQYLEESVYGLTELNRYEVASTRLVANPGCFPTSAILALTPAIKAGIIEPDIIVDSKTGVSGAGRTPSLTTHFPEIDESVMAYAVDGHRHLPEIVQELKKANPSLEPKVTFLTHLIPMTRGILSSCYATLKEGALSSGDAAIEEVQALYRDFYKGEPFVKVASQPPATKHTLGSNNCVVFPTVDLRTNRLIVISCLDNLVKGAAGQAVQNMNLMLGLSETDGLEQPAQYP